MTNQRRSAAVNEGDEATINEKDKLDGYFHHIDVPEISKDLIIGAEPSSTWLFGAPERRRLYHLAETSKFPTLKIGSKIAIQKSVVRAFFWSQQSRAFANDNVEKLVRLRLLLLKLLELMRPAEGDVTPDNDAVYDQLVFGWLATSELIKELTGSQQE
jgi:hypothetical protein